MCVCVYVCVCEVASVQINAVCAPYVLVEGDSTHIAHSHIRWVEAFHGTRYRSGSFSLITEESGSYFMSLLNVAEFYCTARLFFVLLANLQCFNRILQKDTTVDRTMSVASYIVISSTIICISCIV